MQVQTASALSSGVDREYCRSFVARLKDLVARWAHSQRRPPISVDELVVIALILNEPLDAGGVFRWIQSNFLYYRENLIAHAWAKETNTGVGHDAFRQDFKTALRMFDVPLVLLHEDGPSLGTGPLRGTAPLHGPSISSQPLKMTVAVNEGEIYLRRRLLVNRKASNKPFRFMDLPPEIRAMAYDFVFRLPSSGVQIAFRTRRAWGPPKNKVSARVLTRDYHRTADLTEWTATSSGSNHTLTTGPIANRLNLLLVSKLVSKEASPTFYFINKFVCNDIDHLSELLLRTPLSRRSFFGHIAFRFRKCDAPQAAAAFRLLSTVKMLRRLDIYIDEPQWTECKKGKDGLPAFPNVLKVPGIYTLGQIRNDYEAGLQEVNFIGDCEKIRNHLTPLLLKQNEKKNSRKKPGGR